ncbi:hypothetical protein F5148DRAFT_1379582 [Russula earlei]|uniref:Uncharacterized protein n=1 Tax=Russula earlei TaxID=71964 RepID=A0ACC0TUF6_9AGAM|nr:hypothetical protein F5148DRAFT_1379582 [Russula earlei]
MPAAPQIPNVETFTAMFRERLEKYNLQAELTALINDTTGTLIASSYVNPRARIAVIFGSGRNAAYMERVGNIHKIKNLGNRRRGANGHQLARSTRSNMNTLPRTKYDQIIDETSNKPGEQAFERLIFLGESLRLVICELIDVCVLFLRQNTYKIEIPYALDTAFLSLMESDPTEELLMIIGIFTHLLRARDDARGTAVLPGPGQTGRTARRSTERVRHRGDREQDGLPGRGMLRRRGRLSKYPGFADRVHEGLQDIFGDKGRNIVTYHVEDGSGVGSAIIAAMTKIRKEKGLYLNV